MIAAGQNQGLLKLHAQQTCLDAGARNVQACTDAVLKKVGPQIRAAIDAYRQEEQKNYLQSMAQMPNEAKCMTVSEYKMFENLNRDRVKNGIRPVAVDCDLVQSARGHSASMARFSYFDHKNREGKSPNERILAKTKRFRCTAENIARGGTGPHEYNWNNVSHEAQKGLFDSPGHRKNILNPDFTHVGIGIYRGSLEGSDTILYITQNFGGCE